MRFVDPPGFACWRHEGLHLGFEVTYFQTGTDEVRVDGTSTGVQDGDPWILSYSVLLDGSWRTRTATVTTRSWTGQVEVVLETDGAGHWTVNGRPSPSLYGCLDVDLEASAMTNALPAHRLELPIGERADAPAAYVRTKSLVVERLDQTYRRIKDDGSTCRYDYTAPAFDFHCMITYDQSGLVLHYPGIARRSA
jgi:hypothetical protein